MLSLYDFIYDLPYEAWDNLEAKKIINEGHRFVALQASLSEMDNDGFGKDILYFFLDKIIKEDYSVTANTLECFLDILPNFWVGDTKYLEAFQRKLWELGNLILDINVLKRLVFQGDKEIGDVEREAAKAAACYICAKAKEQVGKDLDKDAYASMELCLIQTMKDPGSLEDTNQSWKNKTKVLNEILWGLLDKKKEDDDEVGNEEEIDFSAAQNLINEVNSGIWTVSLDDSQLELINEFLKLIVDKFIKLILKKDLIMSLVMPLDWSVALVSINTAPLNRSQFDQINVMLGIISEHISARGTFIGIPQSEVNAMVLVINNARIFTNSLKEMLDNLAKRPKREVVAVDLGGEPSIELMPQPEPEASMEPGVQFSWTNSLLTLGLIAGAGAISKALGATTPALSPINISAACATTLIVGLLNRNNFNVATDIYTKISAVGFKGYFSSKNEGESLRV